MIRYLGIAHIRKKAGFVFLTALFLLIQANNSFAWRELGHFTICQLGFELANPKTQKIIKGMLDRAKEEYKDLNVSPNENKWIEREFAQQCTWPDHVKRNKTGGFDNTYSWHYINFSDKKGFPKRIIDKYGDGDLRKGFQESKKLLISYLSSPEKNLKSGLHGLRFLGHFVGDLHNPLHLGRDCDKGGNEIKIRWEKKNKEIGNYQKCKLTFNGKIKYGASNTTNLHMIWDRHMVREEYMEHEEAKVEKSCKFLFDIKYTGYAQLIKNKVKFTDKEIQEITKDTFSSWAESESLNRNIAYKYKNEEIKSGAILTYKDYTSEIIDLNGIKMTRLEFVHRQILKAGYRLAESLDRILLKNKQE